MSQDLNLKPIPITLEQIGETIKVKKGLPSNPKRLLIVDVETTGISFVDSEVLEIAGVEVIVCADTNEVYTIKPAFTFFREPVRALISSEIIKLTGIHPHMVKGQKVDLDVVYKYFFAADIVVAHNGAFDRPFIEGIAPELKETPNRWACSCWDPLWKSLGYKKRKLTYLLEALGYSFPAHRAINDCIAVAWMLHLAPHAVGSILKRGLNKSFELKYSKTPFKSNAQLKSLDFRFHNKSWMKNYDSIADMFDDRQALVEHFSQKFPGKDYSTAIKEINPYSRFSLSI